MRFRTLIVEDEAPARDKLRRMLDGETDIDIVGEAADGAAAAKAITDLSPDLVFLDIQIPEISGIELVAQLGVAKPPLIVFVTAHDEHAASAFDWDAIDYLLKPYDRDRLSRCLDRVRQRRLRPDPPVRPLFVPVGDRLRLLDPASIVWIESEDNYVRVHTREHEYLLRRTLQDLLSQLGDRGFARIHRCHAVNIAEIETLSPRFNGDAEVTMRGGRQLRVSRRYRHALFDPA
jgi:two-component system LytT family response regulator